MLGCLAIGSVAKAETTYHVGVGLGPMYSGLGLSVERVRDQDKIALGAGLIHSTSWVGQLYGASLMYHRFDLIGDSGRHALGAGIAPVGHRWGGRFVWEDGRSRIEDSYHDAIYGPLIAYNYHPRRAALGGFHFGISYGHARRDRHTYGGLNMNIGYRF